MDIIRASYVVRVEGDCSGVGFRLGDFEFHQSFAREFQAVGSVRFVIAIVVSILLSIC